MAVEDAEAPRREHQQSDPREEDADQADRGILLLALALPVAWAFAARGAFFRGRHELLPWVIAAALLLPQALLQRRFADALSAPMAVLLGLGASWISRGGARKLVAAAAIAAALLAQAPSASLAWRRIRGVGRETWVGSIDDIVNGERRALEWIRTRSDGSMNSTPDR